ncbi:MAG: xanthine dehydrogenase family protein molybdopterin-binding subunit, partial [Gammaproteobacteria bacterium]|nr:xanthine dehydrogenase family protein molybdopterin-binding subunit [Gammaproteobacteria bacterium]
MRPEADTDRPDAGRGLGRPVPRVEDLNLITGRGRFVDDVAVPGCAWACVVRSPFAHARIRSIDCCPALAASGVLAVLTGDDYVADGLGEIPCISIPPAVMAGRWFRTPFPALTRGRALCVGHAIALVIAETRAQALDAAELVAVDYEPLPATASLAAALAGDAEPVWPDCPDNVCFVHELGDRAATDAVFARARHIIKRRIVNQRIAGSPLEPRAYIGAFDQRDRRYRLVTTTQTPHRIQRLLAEYVFRLPADRIHVQACDVGGGFGTKGNLYPEEVLVLWAAKRVGRPVRWASDRSEAFLSDFNGRDQVADAEMALDEKGGILGLRVVTHTNLGCQVGPSGAHPPLVGSRLLSGTYAIPAMHVIIRGILTHTCTTTTYRGAGRPEAVFVVERLIDMAARQIGVDRVELRRRNL